MQQGEQEHLDTQIEKQVDRVRSALLSNPDAIVLIVPDEFHRHVAQKAFEKQLKNANAATGTVSAIVEAEDELISRSIAALTSLHAIATNSRPHQHQLDGTPIGRALEAQRNGGAERQARRGGAPQAVGEILAQHSPGGTAILWASDVPEPRPTIGQLIRLPNGMTTSIEAIWGYLGKQGELDAFDVTDTVGYRGLVYAHSGEWRIVSQKNEYSDVVEPSAEAQDSTASTETQAAQGNASESTADGNPEPAESAAERDDNDDFGDLEDDEYTITDVEPASADAQPLMIGELAQEQSGVASAEREKAKSKAGGRKRLQHHAAAKKGNAKGSTKGKR